MGTNNMLYQRTLAKKVSVTGIGMHTGKKVTLTLHPAKANFGIQFKRVDLKGNPEVLRAETNNVGTTLNATTLGKGENRVNTVEHLLAVFYGMGINNVYCEIDGPEIPIMDGSGAPFVFLLKETGLLNQSEVKKFIVILQPVIVKVGESWAQIAPSSKLIIDSMIIFAHPKIKTQQEVFEFSCQNFIDEISRARTFGMLRDVDDLKRKGLAKGGSLDNAIVLDDFKVINPDGLRMANEFVKHKVLDTLGDLALLGHEIAGKVTTYKSGHYLQNLLCKKLLETKDAYQVVSANSLQEETRVAFDLPLAMQHSY